MWPWGQCLLWDHTHARWRISWLQIRTLSHNGLHDRDMLSCWSDFGPCLTHVTQDFQICLHQLSVLTFVPRLPPMFVARFCCSPRQYLNIIDYRSMQPKRRIFFFCITFLIDLLLWLQSWTTVHFSALSTRQDERVRLRHCLQHEVVSTASKKEGRWGTWCHLLQRDKENPPSPIFSPAKAVFSEDGHFNGVKWEREDKRMKARKNVTLCVLQDPQKPSTAMF